MRGIVATLTVAMTATVGLAQPFVVDWYTIDGGGGYSSVLTFQGLFELEGTIGQPDASDELLSVDGYSVIGGFWVGGTQTPCSDIDFNNNGVFPEDQDVVDYFNVLAGGSCSTGDCDTIDFNGNGVFPEDQDVVDYFNVLAGGSCA
ncbi:MAG: hypothetical protein ACK5ZG_12430 [Phycisphaerae bacterium]|jgi:hypothetical protein